ncbi:MAG: hypothetical protein ACM3O2_00115 [Syntrophothermus sp.]|jgi:hypothetical protein|uniref:Uncharacterized protein n=1 Tax=freshwater sediment metagenome TaxID=556182 RepID=A0AA48RCM6_9ZZZZ
MIGRVAILVAAAGMAALLGYATSVELMPRRAECTTFGCHLMIAGK